MPVSISKRAMGVDGYKSSPRPVPLIADLMGMAPKEVVVNEKKYTLKFAQVDSKKLVQFCYTSAAHGDVKITTKLNTIDEVANQRKFVAELIGEEIVCR